MKRFFIIFLLLFIFLFADDYANIHCWHFKNFGITELPWDIFEKSFIGISPVDPLDIAFYEAYNAAFSVTTGNCFGMSLLALLIDKEEGHLGFCKPVYTYRGDDNGPSDPGLRDAILIMQCHEWSHSGINWIIDVFNNGHIFDPNYAYSQVEYYLAKEDPPLITIVKDMSLVGHTLIPYKTASKSGKKYIYVYDSNRYFPKDSSYYLNDSNYIEISGSSWSFRMLNDTIFKSPDGMIYVTPISVVKGTSRNPLELGCVLDELNGLFLSGAVCSQIEDDKGRKFYNMSGTDIERDNSKRIKNIIKLPITGRLKSDEVPEIYFYRGSPSKELSFNIKPKKTDYRFTIAGGNNFIKIKGKGNLGENDEIKIGITGELRGRILIKTKRLNSDFEIEMTRKISEDTYRTFVISNIKLEKPVEVKMSENGEGVYINSEKENVQFDLKIKEFKKGKVKEIESKNLNFKGGKWNLIKPENWKNVDKSRINIIEMEKK